MMKSIQTKLSLLLCIICLCVSCSPAKPTTPASLLPESEGSAYTVLSNNQPDFSDSDLVAKSFERYSELDALGRCGVAYACIGQDIMPTEERGAIGQIKPTGWQTIKYDHVDGKYLYNRCHLIGYQLTGENANEKNLITGTRYLNTEGMLPFENRIAEYVKATGNHVLYRVTPVFEGSNLLANGVILEAKSVEDNGQGVCFHVYCHNIQPGVEIDYATGISKAEGASSISENIVSSSDSSPASVQEYILNRSSQKFHLTTCSSVKDIKEKNREAYTGDRQIVIDAGYSPCKNCNP